MPQITPLTDPLSPFYYRSQVTVSVRTRRNSHPGLGDSPLSFLKDLHLQLIRLLPSPTHP